MNSGSLLCSRAGNYCSSSFIWSRSSGAGAPESRLTLENELISKSCLRAACCEHLRNPRLPPPLYPPTSLSHLFPFFSITDEPLDKFSQALKINQHFITDNHS